MCKRDGSKSSDEGEKGNRPYWKWTVTLDINTYPRVPPATLYFPSCYSFIKNIARRKKRYLFEDWKPERT